MKISDRIVNRVRLWGKQVYQRLQPYQDQKRILFIVGKQRSGTTMLNDIFERDWRVKAYGEEGLARGWGRGTALRLIPYEKIKQVFAAERADLLVAKPLVESQHTVALLEYFAGSKAVWVYRHYKDVARSSFKRFGEAPVHYNLQAVIDPELHDHWYAEGISEKTCQVVRKYYRDDASPFELNVLSWYVRNILFFEQELQDHPDVILCRYADLVIRPAEIMRGLYRFVDFSYPGDQIISQVHTHSVGKGSQLELNSEIEQLAEELLQRLDAAFAQPKNNPVLQPI